jgi:OmpA-OmpF porin, OOP family
MKFTIVIAMVCCMVTVANGFHSTSKTDTTDNQNTEVVLTGSILNARTKNPITAEFDLYLDSDVIKEDVLIVKDGKYMEVLTKLGWYLIEISAPGYLGVSDTLWVTDNYRKTIRKDYLMEPLETGLRVVMDNVNFYFGGTTLTVESHPHLDKIVEFLQKNPNVSFEIAGHTDDEGPEDYNLTLSQGRAQSVLNYLVNHGADASKLTAKGYGESKPIDVTNTKAGKAKNRRVEFIVLSN